MSDKGKTLSVRLDGKLAKRLDWLHKITGWPEAFIIRMLLKRAKPSDLGLVGSDIEKARLDDLGIKDVPKVEESQ